MVDCPVCGLPTDERQRYTIRFEGKSMEMIVIRCLNYHWIAGPIDDLKGN